MNTRFLFLAMLGLLAVFVFFPVSKFALVNLGSLGGDYVLAEDENATTTDDDEDEEEVDNVDDVNVNALASARGVFKLLGRVTAVNAASSTSTLAVNGVAVDASGAKIRRGSGRALESVKVGDRVVVSGTIENGVLLAKKVVVRGFSGPKLDTDAAKKLREEMNQRIQEILKKISDLQQKINERLGR